MGLIVLTKRASPTLSSYNAVVIGHLIETFAKRLFSPPALLANDHLLFINSALPPGWEQKSLFLHTASSYAKLANIMYNNILQLLQNSLQRLRKSEQKVALYVLKNPHDVVNMRIIDLASEAEVSEPTVIRFCRALDYAGFQEFKLALAQDVSLFVDLETTQISQNDSVDEYLPKVFDSAIAYLLKLRSEIDPKNISHSVRMIRQARRIEIIAQGASVGVASELSKKFGRLLINSQYSLDPYTQAMNTTLLGVHDMLFIISSTGNSKALIYSLEIAQERRTPVLSLCPRDSIIGQGSTLNINMAPAVPEHKDVYTSMTTRLAYLLAVDLLAVGLSLQDASHYTRLMRDINQRLSKLYINE